MTLRKILQMANCSPDKRRWIGIMALCMASRFSAMAVTNDVSSYLEYLGVAGIERYNAANGQLLRRTIQVLKAYDGRIFLGQDNSNFGGPVDVTYFDPTIASLVKEAALPEELLSAYAVFGGQFYFPSDDPMTPNETISFYRREGPGRWRRQPVVGAAHAEGFSIYQNKIFFSIGSLGTTTYPRISISTNDGASVFFSEQALAPADASTTFRYGTSFQSAGNLYYCRMGGYDLTPSLPFMIKYVDAGTNWQTVHQAATNFWGTSLGSKSIDSAVGFNGRAYVISSGSLYSVDNIETGGPVLASLPAPASGNVSRLLTNGSTLYAVANYFPVGSQPGTVLVARTDDGVTWTEHFRVTAARPLRAEFWDGDFFFGLGSSDESSGEMWRMRWQAIVGATRPLVHLSASLTDTVVSPMVVWEGAGSNLWFTVKRSYGLTGADLAVNYSVAGTAVPGTHFTPLSGSVTIPAGQYSATVAIPVLTNAVADGNHTLTIQLSPSGNYDVVAPAQLTFEILDDDLPALKIPRNGLSLWLAGGQGVGIDGSNRALSWQDQSTNQFAGLQTNAANRPLLVPNALNGQSVLRFANNSSINFGLTGTELYYMAVVFSNATPIDGSSSSQSLLSGDAFFNYLRLGGSAVLETWRAQWADSSRTIAAGSHLVTAQQTAPYTPYKFRLDQQDLTVGGANTQQTITLYGDNLSIGSASGNSFAGDIAEVIVYSRPLTPAESQAVENYLYQKYFGPRMLASSASKSGSAFQFNMAIQPGKTYVLETSTNLVQWTPIATNTPVSSPLPVADSNATQPRKYYRSHTLP